MKKRILPRLLLLAVALLLAFPWLKTGWRILRVGGLSGKIVEFYYGSGGQFWDKTREIIQRDGETWAVYFYRSDWPGPVIEGGEEMETGTEERRETPLTEEQMEKFNDLVLRQLRLPLWEGHYELLNPVTCGDGWRITCVLEDGREFSTSGYMVYPDGLAEINQFFSELFPAE